MGLISIACNPYPGPDITQPVKVTFPVAVTHSYNKYEVLNCAHIQGIHFQLNEISVPQIHGKRKLLG